MWPVLCWLSWVRRSETRMRSAWRASTTRACADQRGMSPVSPKYPCARCRRVHCVCPPQAPRPAWQDSQPTKDRRPDYVTYAERKRRKDTVDAWLEQHSHGNVHGKQVAICPDCHQARASWVADHITPMARGGDESGPLRVHCVSCSRKQGARLAGEHRRG